MLRRPLWLRHVGVSAAPPPAIKAHSATATVNRLCSVRGQTIHRLNRPRPSSSSSLLASLFTQRSSKETLFLSSPFHGPDSWSALRPRLLSRRCWIFFPSDCLINRELVVPPGPRQVPEPEAPLSEDSRRHTQGRSLPGGAFFRVRQEIPAT